MSSGKIVDELGCSDQTVRRWLKKHGIEIRKGSQTGTLDLDALLERQTPGREKAYRILGLDPEANRAAIREAYQVKVKETHPDHGGDPEEFRRVREAYELLVD